MGKKLKKFGSWMNQLKFNQKIVMAFIALDIFLAVGSNIADWPWLMSVDWYLMPFAPICSLYPLLLSVWFTFYYFKKKAPNWLTTFIFIGITSYGVMAWIYFPLYMGWEGISWWRIGNMLWVAIYALQSLVIASELRPLKLWQYLPIIGYFFFKDFADRFLGTFIDLRQPNYPEWFKNFFGAAVVLFHITALTVAVKLSRKTNARQSTPTSVKKAVGTASTLSPNFQNILTE